MAKKKYKKDCRLCGGSGKYQRDSDPHAVEIVECDCHKGHNVYTDPKQANRYASPYGRGMF